MTARSSEGRFERFCAKAQLLFAAVALPGALISCGKAVTLPSGASPQTDSPGSYIQHVVIVVQENHSFDNLFAKFPGADGATIGKTSNGATVELKESKLYSAKILGHGHRDFVKDYHHAKMDGWNLDCVKQHLDPLCAYEYVDPSQIAPYWTMAAQYALADHMFPTESSGSFSAHQDLIRGDSAITDHESLIDFPSKPPWGCDADPGTTTVLITRENQELVTGPAPCTNKFPDPSAYRTLRDLLDEKSISWKYYVPRLTSNALAGAIWNAYDVIWPVRYGPEWNTNVSFPEKNIFRDIRDGTLPSVAWVIPDNVNSDHGGYQFGRTDKGPSWVAQIVNAVGTSRYWSSTAIIIVWDDWGGWYDHVPPPQLDYAGLGIRVPMIVVSPYAKSGYVSHTQYEFGSIVKFVEDVWSLGRLDTTDVRANSITDMFEFKRTARQFKPIRAAYSMEFYERQPPSNLPVDGY
ncbi:MAG: hypothetical protein JO350_03950 [Candidatus Eremiobacteraeota bacterium]|nr:hypothetical protein [Candidatus Eremiobacteraeota bacterium]